MSSEAQSNDTKTRSADVDDNEDLTRAVRSAGNDHDLTTAEDQVSASTATPMDDDEGDHCSPGRPTKLTAGTQAAICARIAAGMAAEHAAECAGVSAATYYGWMADGRRVAARGGDVGHLSEGDKRCLDFVWAVRRAKAESLAEIERAVFDAATGKTPRKKTIHSSKQLANGHGKVCDDDGNPVWVDAVRVEVTDGPDVKALFALMRHRSADLRFDLPPAEMDANAVRCMDDELHLRLAKSIRV